MNNRMVLVSGLVVFLLVSSAGVEGGSIWAKRGKNMRDLYADDVARYIGDILTINIIEASKVDNKSKRDLKKETSRSTVFNGELGEIFETGLIDLGEFGMSASSKNELKGKADYKDERKFTDSITVVVVDVLPNGNLVVMGSRSRNIAGDIQTIDVSGIVRPSDIAFDNTIKSEQIADFRIISRNKGVAEPYNRQSWLGRIFDVIWPL